jgi:hypothetical protein
MISSPEPIEGERIVEYIAITISPLLRDGATGTAQAAIRPPVAVRPTAQEMNLEFAALSGPSATYPGKPGSDFMVDVLRTLNIDYIATNPASSCRGIHESIINYNPGHHRRRICYA